MCCEMRCSRCQQRAVLKALTLQCHCVPVLYKYFTLTTELDILRDGTKTLLVECSSSYSAVRDLHLLRR
jgi:hypothetical protein